MPDNPLGADLEKNSGRWVGFWIQGLQRGYMGLTLRFSHGRIVGDGIDQIAAFRFSGKYSQSGYVRMWKRYPTHRVLYSGKWDGAVISGAWRIERWDSGRFEIWPEPEEEAIEKIEQPEPEILRAPDRSPVVATFALFWCS